MTDPPTEQPTEQTTEQTAPDEPQPEATPGIIYTCIHTTRFLHVQTFLRFLRRSSLIIIFTVFFHNNSTSISLNNIPKSQIFNYFKAEEGQDDTPKDGAEGEPVTETQEVAEGEGEQPADGGGTAAADETKPEGNTQYSVINTENITKHFV